MAGALAGFSYNSPDTGVLPGPERVLTWTRWIFEGVDVDVAGTEGQVGRRAGFR